MAGNSTISKLLVSNIHSSSVKSDVYYQNMQVTTLTVIAIISVTAGRLKQVELYNI